jgi:hypothetical protein
MTTVSEPVGVSPRSSTPVRAAWLWIALIVVELLWATYAVDAERQFAIHVPWWEHHARAVQWSFLSVPFVLLAIAAGIGAWSARRGLVAVGLCAVGVAVTIGSYELIDYLFTHSTPSLTVVKVVDYATLMLVTSLAALAWCASRRRGVSWLLPVVLVAAASAALVRWWDVSARWPELTGHPTLLVRAGLTEIVPVVLACLVAWAMEAKATRQAS